LRRKIHALLIPTTTFVIGILVQSLFDNIITSSNLPSLSTATIMIGIFVIFLHLTQIDTRFDHVDRQLIDITNRTGIYAEYIEDGAEGKSYIRATELVEKARTSLIFVGDWEPFPEYQANNISVMKGNSRVLDARKDFYQALIKQIEAHRFDGTPFHRRIVQVPKEYIDKRLPFETDPVFFEYMLYTAKIQASVPHACVLKKADAFFNVNFTVIDNRYVVIPILTHIKHVLQARHGALIIEDIDGKLIAQLNAIYWALEGRSKPLASEELSSSANKE
jgi:hypothetical protein